MAKTVEIFYAIQNGRPSIRFHVTDIVEGNAKEKILEMLNDLPIPESVVNSLKDPLSVPILPTAVKDEEVQDVPCALPPAQEEAPPSNIVCPEPQENASKQKKKHVRPAERKSHCRRLQQSGRGFRKEESLNSSFAGITTLSALKICLAVSHGTLFTITTTDSTPSPNSNGGCCKT